MANKSKYKFTADVPSYQEVGYMENKAGLLVNSVNHVKGIRAFGPNGGTLKEEDLTDEIVDWLITRGFEKYLTKKEKNEK